MSYHCTANNIKISCINESVPHLLVAEFSAGFES